VIYLQLLVKFVVKLLMQNWTYLTIAKALVNMGMEKWGLVLWLDTQPQTSSGGQGGCQNPGRFKLPPGVIYARSTARRKSLTRQMISIPKAPRRPSFFWQQRLLNTATVPVGVLRTQASRSTLRRLTLLAGLHFHHRFSARQRFAATPTLLC
jgi:hypothetical protein